MKKTHKLRVCPSPISFDDISVILDFEDRGKFQVSISCGLYTRSTQPTQSKLVFNSCTVSNIFVSLLPTQIPHRNKLSK